MAMTRSISGAYFLIVDSIPPFSVKSLTTSYTSTVELNFYSMFLQYSLDLHRHHHWQEKDELRLRLSQFSLLAYPLKFYFGEHPAIVVMRTISVGGKLSLRFATSLTILRAISSKANGIFVPS